MSYDHADVIWTVRLADSAKGLELLARHDGLFEFRESLQIDYTHPIDGPQKIWGHGYSSGLFGTREEAEREARAVINWLGEA